VFKEKSLEVRLKMKKYIKEKKPSSIRFANFLTIIAFLGMIYSVSCTFSFLFFMAYSLIVILLALVTLFTVNYTDSINNRFEIIKDLFNTVPFVVYYVLALSLVSFIIIILKKGYKSYLHGKSIMNVDIFIFVVSLVILAIHVFKLISY
jgi:lysylphosphatidylglycerol synthetase-like protein (DUF2156 family)